MIFYRTLLLLMVCILITIYSPVSHAGLDDTNTDFDLHHNSLPLPGFSRADWGYSYGGVNFYFGRVKVLDHSHIVIQKLYAEVGSENSPALEGVRVFIDQLEFIGDAQKGWVISADNIYLGCRQNSNCSKTFQTDEQEILIGLDSLKVFAEQGIIDKPIEDITFPLKWWDSSGTIIGTVKGVWFSGVRKHLNMESYFNANHWALLDDHFINLDFQITGGGLEKNLVGVVILDHDPLVGFKLNKSRIIKSKAVNGWSVELADIRRQNYQYIGIYIKLKTARLAGIALFQLISRWLPMQPEFPDNSKFTRFIDKGSSLEFFLPQVIPIEHNNSGDKGEVDPRFDFQATSFQD